LKIDEPVLAVETERLLGARGAHRSAVFAEKLPCRSAGDGIFAGRIVAIRASNLAAKADRRRLSRRRLCLPDAKPSSLLAISAGEVELLLRTTEFCTSFFGGKICSLWCIVGTPQWVVPTT